MSVALNSNHPLIMKGLKVKNVLSIITRTVNDVIEGDVRFYSKINQSRNSVRIKIGVIS